MAPRTPINQFIPYCPFQKALFTVGSNMAEVTIIYCFSLTLSAAPQTHGHRGQQDGRMYVLPAGSGGQSIFVLVRDLCTVLNFSHLQ